MVPPGQRAGGDRDKVSSPPGSSPPRSPSGEGGAASPKASFKAAKGAGGLRHRSKSAFYTEAGEGHEVASSSSFIRGTSGVTSTGGLAALLGLPNDARFELGGRGKGVLLDALRARCEQLSSQMERAWGLDSLVMRDEMHDLEGEMYGGGATLDAQLSGAGAARRNAARRGGGGRMDGDGGDTVCAYRARMRWARALAFVAMERASDQKVFGGLKFGLAVHAAHKAEKAQKAILNDAHERAERARQQARKAADSRELLAHRTDELTAQHTKLQAEHAEVTSTSEKHAAKVRQLEDRLHRAVGYEEGHAERAVRLEEGRASRLESEVQTLRWQLERVSAERDRLSEALKSERQTKHVIGASLAELQERAATEHDELTHATAKLARLSDTLAVERHISRERMAKIIEERRRTRLIAEEPMHRQPQPPRTANLSPVSDAGRGDHYGARDTTSGRSSPTLSQSMWTAESLAPPGYFLEPVGVKQMLAELEDGPPMPLPAIKAPLARDVADVLGDRTLPAVKTQDLLALPSGTLFVDAPRARAGGGLLHSFSQPPSMMMARSPRRGLGHKGAAVKLGGIRQPKRRTFNPAPQGNVVVAGAEQWRPR